MLLSPAFTGLTGGLPSAASAEARAACAADIAEVKVVYAVFFSWSVTASSRAAFRGLFAVRRALRKGFSIAFFF